MRITNNMMIASTVRNLNNNAARLSKAQEQMSTQSKIQLASDDPVIAARAIKYRSYVSKVEQYQKTVEDALSWQEVTDSALNDLGDVIKQLQEYTVQASTGTLSDSDREAIKANIGQLKQQVVEIMNSSYADRYIFGGYVTDSAPYSQVETPVGDKIMFKGQYVSLGGPVAVSVSDADIIEFCTANLAQMYTGGSAQGIQYNIGYGNQMVVNTEGQDVIGTAAGGNLFDTIDKLLLGLDGAASYKTAAIDAASGEVTVSETAFTLDDLLTDLDTDLDRLLTARADLGARMNYLTMTKDRLSNDYNPYTKLMSSNEDIDVVEASFEVSTAQYVYEASLSVGAKVISKSLVDYLS